MKLLIITLLAIFYVGCGGQAEANDADPGQELLGEDQMDDVETGEQSDEDFTFNNEGFTLKELTCEKEGQNSITLSFKSGSFPCSKEAAAGSTCFCEVSSNGGLLITYARNDRNWCDKKEAEVMAGGAIVYEGGSWTKHVGMNCSDDQSEE